MKTLSLIPRTSSWLAAFALGLSLCRTSAATASFTVTPSTVSNTYSGFITLQVAGLNSGETVVVQKFIDLNTNGVIDGSDWLVQQFQLTDGQAGMVIGGIVNSNAPGDTDSTGTQITAKLNFQSGDFIQNIVGKHLYKLSSPTGRFAPVTNLFTVTNFSFGQNFSGSVFSNNTSTPVPYSVVLLFPPPRPGQGGPGGPPLAGAVANSVGSYTIQAPPGSYSLVAFKSNYLANFAAMSAMPLGSGLTVPANLTMTNTTASISGTLVDTNNSSLALPGVMVSASANGLFGVGYTDTNGNFSVRVQSGQWNIKADDLSLMFHGYVGLQNGSNINSGTTGKTLGYPKATALFYGSVKDTLGNPLAGVDIYAYDNSRDLYQTDGCTDTNGNYFAAILGGLGSNDPWWLDVSSDNTLTNYVISQPTFLQNGGTNASAGTAVLANFTALLGTNHIVGNVSCNGTNIVGVGVNAFASINGTNYQAHTDTGTNGNYWLNVPNGNWNISVNCSGGNDSLDNTIGFGTYMCPNNQAATINNNNATNNFPVQPCGIVLILTTNLPDGQVDSYYNRFLQGLSCGTLTWSLNDPPNFPASLSFGGNGQIQGTPDTSGTYNFSVHLDDGNGHSTNQALSLYIAPASVPLQVTTTSLPDGTNGILYSQSLEAIGGQLPCNWSLSPGSASLPPGLSLTATNGLISGTPTHSGIYEFSVRVTDDAAATADQFLSLTITGGMPDVLFYYVTKLEACVQLATTNIVLNTNAGPYTAFLGIIQSSLGRVPLANISLPTGAVKAFPRGNSVIELQSRESFPNLESFDTAYPPGNYNFALYGLNDGLMFPVLAMPAPVYPNPPRVNNYAAAQSLNPLADFTLQWDAGPGATTDDALWVVITDTNGNPVFSTPYPALDPAGALKGTATSVIIPTSTFQPGRVYTGTITFFRTTSTNTTDYPGAVGATVVGVQTWFPLTTLSASPVLSQAAKASSTQFRFLLSGLAGQNYTIQMSTNLNSTNWLPLFITNAPANSFMVIDPAATNPQRFYRALFGP